MQLTIRNTIAGLALSSLLAGCALLSAMNGQGPGGADAPAFCRVTEMSSAALANGSEIRDRGIVMRRNLENRCSVLCKNEAACTEGKQLLHDYYVNNLKAHASSPFAWPTLLMAVTDSHLNVEGTKERYTIGDLAPLAAEIEKGRVAEAKARLTSTGTFDRHTDGNECVFSDAPFKSPENPRQSLAYVFNGPGRTVHFRCYSDRVFGNFPMRENQELYAVVEVEGLNNGMADDMYIQVVFQSLGDPRLLGAIKVADGSFTVPDGPRASANGAVYRVTLKNQYVNGYRDTLQGDAIVRQPIFEKENLAYARMVWFR
jgi:hypothetical protein